MFVLGIETSCDETAIAIVKNGRILSDSVSSSVHLHKKFGGVIPEIACRYHVEYIGYVLEDALKKANVGLEKIGLIAVTVKPGLVGALLVGVSMAKALSMAKGIPLIGIDHLIAHLYAVFMNNGKRIDFPYIGMIVSGGHTNIFRINDSNRYKLLGQTLDDAAGEAFDKVAKILRLGYPGGPIIQKRAQHGKIDKRRFSRSSFDDTLNFSFSGIKTAVLYHIRDRLKEKGVTRLGEREIDNIAASFQDAITDTLTDKAIVACKKEKIKRLVLGGGVSSNSELRRKIINRSVENDIKLYLPSKRLCVDNAAMVAGLGDTLYKKGVKSDLSLTAQSTCDYKT